MAVAFEADEVARLDRAELKQRPLDDSARPINVFVHLARGFSGKEWNRRYLDGKVLGLNEPWPYGYHHAEHLGCRITYSEDSPEGALGKVLRMGFRGLLGFDVVHAWRNREGMRRADVVWTHTESQSCGVGLLKRLGVLDGRIRTIFQSVWLIDRWPRLLLPQKMLMKYALTAGDRLTFHAEDNCKIAKELFPGADCSVVPFGISTAISKPPALRPDRLQLRLIALGNDVHRDWATLLSAVRGERDLSLRILSRTAPQALIDRAENAERHLAKNNEELLAAFEWADAVVVPLGPNLHASGITVIQEAVILGKPVIATDVGGLRSYFGDGEIAYVPVGDVEALRRTIARLRPEGEAFQRAAERAQGRMLRGEVGSIAYARRHAEISRELMGAGVAVAVSPAH